MHQSVNPSLMFAITFSCLGLVGCASGNSPLTTTSDKSVQILGYSAVRTLLDESKPRPVLVDVRIDKAAFDADHIPQAIHIPLHQLKSNDPRLSGAITIIVYSADSVDRLSTAATKKILRYGLSVYEFRGGLAEWNRAHRAKPPEAEPAPSPNP
jgi:rhodanese-related sulfurtransferase